MRIVQLCLSITLLIALNFVTVAQPGKDLNGLGKA